MRQTLESFTGLAVPAATDWEILVVNNNCTDQTDQVIQAYQDRLPVRRAFEPRPGLSHARNRAIAEATGDYILWTDDDVTVSPNWLVCTSMYSGAGPMPLCSVVQYSPCWSTPP